MKLAICRTSFGIIMLIIMYVKLGIWRSRCLTFLSLCCERYLNNQIIDAVIKTFWLQSSDQVRKKTICLTTFTSTWASLSLTQGDPSSTRHLQQHLEYITKGTTADDLRKVLVPVHINNSQCGIARIFIPTKTLWYNDSLKWVPPR